MAAIVAQKKRIPTPRKLTSKNDALLKARLFLNAEAVRQHAMSMWLAVKPELRVETALELFQANEVTLERAAEIAGQNRWVFHETLKRRGLKIIIEVDSVEELEAAARAIRKSR